MKRYERIVHLADLLNTTTQNRDLAHQALRGLMIESVAEFLDHDGLKKATLFWNPDSQKVDAVGTEELARQKVAIEHAL